MQEIFRIYDGLKVAACDRNLEKGHNWLNLQNNSWQSCEKNPCRVWTNNFKKKKKKKICKITAGKVLRKILARFGQITLRRRRILKCHHRSQPELKSHMHQTNVLKLLSDSQNSTPFYRKSISVGCWNQRSTRADTGTRHNRIQKTTQQTKPNQALCPN